MENNKEETKNLRLGWNWGAFLLAPYFAFANGAYLCLLMLIPIPIFNIVWMFVSGVKGSEWALNSGLFKTEDGFNATMKSWDRAGIACAVLIGIGIILFTIALSAGTALFSTYKNFY